MAILCFISVVLFNMVSSRLIALSISEMNEIYKKMANFAKADISALRNRTSSAYSNRMLKIATSGVKKASFKIVNAKSKVGNHLNHNMTNQVIEKKYNEFRLSLLNKAFLLLFSILPPMILYAFNATLYRIETSELQQVLKVTKNMVKKEITGSFLMTYIPIYSFSETYQGIDVKVDFLKEYLNEFEISSEISNF